MTLREARVLFSSCVVLLLQRAHTLGFEAALDYVRRCPDCQIGHPRSTHKAALAVDLVLYRDGTYVTDTESHRPLGEYWESLHPECRWGGRWGDGNHYSITWEGVS